MDWFSLPYKPPFDKNTTGTNMSVSYLDIHRKLTTEDDYK